MLIWPDIHFEKAVVADSLGQYDAPRLRFSKAEYLPTGWLGLVAYTLGLPQLAGANPAALLASMHGIQGSAWIATPLQFMAGLQTVHLPQNGILCLEEAERAELVCSFEHVFGATTQRLRIQSVAADTFILTGLEADLAITVDPSRVLGRNIESALPFGETSGCVRALLSEIEMWLHGQPLNLKREAQGLPRISSLWLWGGGAASYVRYVVASPQALTEKLMGLLPPLFYGDDSLLSALCYLGGVERRPLSHAKFLNELLGSSTSAVWYVAPFEYEFFTILLASFQKGDFKTLTVVANDHKVQISRGDSWYFWRTKNDIFKALS